MGELNSDDVRMMNSERKLSIYGDDSRIAKKSEINNTDRNGAKRAFILDHKSQEDIEQLVVYNEKDKDRIKYMLKNMKGDYEDEFKTSKNKPETDNKAEKHIEEARNFDVDGKDEDAKESNPLKKLSSSTMAEYLMEDNSYVLIDENLHCYNEEQEYWSIIQQKESKSALRRTIPVKYRDFISNSFLSEIYEWLLIDCKHINPASLNKRKDYLNFLDGVYSLKEGKLIEHDKDLYFQNVLNVKYNAISKRLGNSYYDYFINSTFNSDLDTIRCFEEFMGLALSCIRDAKVAFFLYGPSNSGKSVILNVLKSLIGEQFTSSLSFSQLASEFAVAQLVGKWLNISGEMSGIANKRIDIFKSLTGNDKVTACFKGKDHFQFKNQALLVFGCNNFPQINSEHVEAFASRIIVFPFKNAVDRENWIPNLAEKLLQESDIIVQRAIKGLKRLMERNFEFIESDEMSKCKLEFIGEKNSFILFAKKHIAVNAESQVASKSIREYYYKFCDLYDYNKVADNTWSKALTEMFTVIKTNITSGDALQKGITYNSRGYKGIEFKNLDELEGGIINET